MKEAREAIEREIKELTEEWSEAESGRCSMPDSYLYYLHGKIKALQFALKAIEEVGDE